MKGRVPGENEILWHLAPALTVQNFEVLYYDIDSGIPSQDDTESAHGIVSWYRGPVMKQAEKYILWLKKQLDQNRKVLIFGNFGAFQDADTKVWISHDPLNFFF